MSTGPDSNHRDGYSPVSQNERYNLERAYQEVGDFGRMQKLLAFAMSIARQQGSLIRYCFSFITLKQVYLCAVNGS